MAFNLPKHWESWLMIGGLYEKSINQHKVC